MSETIRCQSSCPGFLLSQFIVWQQHFFGSLKVLQQLQPTLIMGAMTASTFNFCGSTLWELPCSSVESCGSTGRGCRLVGAWWSWAGAKVSESAPKPPTARTLAAAYAENSTRWTRRSQAINDIAHLLLTGRTLDNYEQYNLQEECAPWTLRGWETTRSVGIIPPIVHHLLTISHTISYSQAGHLWSTLCTGRLFSIAPHKI